MKATDDINDRRMAKALRHPLRQRIIKTLEGRTASPKELSLALGAELRTVAYHVRKLRAYGLIELVDTAPRRGARSSISTDFNRLTDSRALSAVRR